jgi:hypothetical protein
MVDLHALSNRELLDVWGGSLELLRARGVVRTYNNPIGDIAEEIVASHYAGERGGFSQAAWDVRVGERLLQVKACRRATPKTKLGFSPVRHRDGYSALILVVFSADMRIEQAWRIPRQVVNELAVYNAHVNGLKIGLGPDVTGHGDVERLDLSTDVIDGPAD